MTIKHQIRHLAEQMTGTRIYRSLPRGVDIAADLARDLPRLRVERVFDVGANVGQSALEFLHWFPQARIHCFEPVEATFRTLCERVQGEPRIEPRRLALGSDCGEARMVLEGPSEMHHLEKGTGTGAGAGSGGAPVEVVALLTLDRYCREAGIARIGYLKIDTEGADLEVLEGAQELLERQCIDLVQVEAGMNRRNRRHVPLERLKDFLESRGYFLFGLYEQVNEWPSGEPQLRRCNCVFVSDAVIRANREGAGAMLS